MFTVRDVEAKGFSDVVPVESHSEKKGWNESGEDLFVGKKSGTWYRITVTWRDNSYKADSSDHWSEEEVSAREAAKLGAKT